MKVGIEANTKDISTVIEILNSHVNGEMRLDDALLDLLSKNVSSSDFLFLVLQKLERDGYVRGSKGILKMEKEIEEGEKKNVTKEIMTELEKSKKLFVTPLEVGKLYQCPRRLFLEKMVLSRQQKEERGKTWDGEVIHLSINLLIKNFLKKPLEELIEEIPKAAIEKYKWKSTVTEDVLKDFLIKFDEMIKEEKFSRMFTETIFQSFKIGLVGTPDIICIKEDGDIIPMDIKLGRIDRRGVKEEHLLQGVGEALLVEDFFRKKINFSYLLYFGSNSLVKIDLDEEKKRKFLNYKRQIEKMVKGNLIPGMSMLPNSKRRVCIGCHVKQACENIETLRGIRY